jgi:hypothetical protein
LPSQPLSPYPNSLTAKALNCSNAFAVPKQFTF